MRNVFPLLLGLLVLAGCGKSKKPEVAVTQSADASAKAKQGSSSDSETPDAAKQLLVHAAKLTSRGMVGKAIETLSQAIATDPDNAELYLARAEVYGLIKEDASALADYSIAISPQAE